MSTIETKNEVEKGCYFGPRDETFKDLIFEILKKSGVKHLKTLTNGKSLTIFASAFTSESIDKNSNYQVLEQLGDLSANKFIVYYIYRRFPQLKCAEGVKVAARLRINYGSKHSFAKIAEKCGFWPFISATNELRSREKESLLEDVFEAFLGAVEIILDTHTAEKFEENKDEFIGVGYANVYKILRTLFDEMPISLEYEDLYDAKTRLKELFDLFGDDSNRNSSLPPLGPLIYESEKKDFITVCRAYRMNGARYEIRPDGTINMKKIIYPRERTNCKLLIGQGTAPLKDEAEQLTANNALETLANQGYVKHAPTVYAKFSGKYIPQPHTTNEKDVLRICETKENINNQFPTRGKSKYQNKYVSTPLIHFCRERDIDGVSICLEMGADTNIYDYIGMTALDVLFIGPKDEKTVKKVMKKLLVKNPLVMNQNVYDSYYKQYEGEEFFIRSKEFIKVE